MSIPVADTPNKRKARGAFFTPEPIADFLADWAVAGHADAKVLDPTCGEAVFLLAAQRALASAGAEPTRSSQQLFGVDLHRESLDASAELLRSEGATATLIEGDFFAEPSPLELGSRIPLVDAVVGNPPFIRYQNHVGATRKRSREAAMAQGVRLSGLASSWASLLVHASAFLKPEGRIAMVLPAELLTVGYAEPIRLWLRRRFEAVHLVTFEHLQFADAEEQVVLLVARGSGGCDAFALHQLQDASELQSLHAFDGVAVAPSGGKWTDLLLTTDDRATYSDACQEAMSPLSTYADIELGAVTGANKFFAIDEATRVAFGINQKDLTKIAPPGSRFLTSSRFTRGAWERLRGEGHRVWLLSPRNREPTDGLAKYIAVGRKDGIDKGYKCSQREPWWRPPRAKSYDLMFTYMNHRFPRMIANAAGAGLLNSVHGVQLHDRSRLWVRDALPLLSLNSLTQLGAELNGRSYGGGVLKLEPTEASVLPVPKEDVLEVAWSNIADRRAQLDRLYRSGAWDELVEIVDAAVLEAGAGLPTASASRIRESARRLRERRMRKRPVVGDDGER